MTQKTIVIHGTKYNQNMTLSASIRYSLIKILAGKSAVIINTKISAINEDCKIDLSDFEEKDEGILLENNHFGFSPKISPNQKKGK